MNLQGKDAVDDDALEAAVKLACDRLQMFAEDKLVADGLCRAKKEKKTKKDPWPN